MIARFFLLMFILPLAARMPPGYAPTKGIQPETQIEVRFTNLPQGRIGEVWVSGEGVSRVRAAFLDHQYLFLPDEYADFRGFISAPMDAEPGWYRLSILVTYQANQEAYFARDIRVTAGVFAWTNLAVPAALDELIAPDVYLDEFSVLDDYLTVLSEGENWLVNGLTPPFATGMSAGFGNYRSFNGGSWQRHTGIDYPRPVGTPAAAATDGRVVLAERLAIRGLYVLVDHGAGLFSGYAHLDEAFVQPGDMVQKGDIIGAIGSSGRSLGPHLHWELSLGGTWVDPLQLVELTQ